jgi:hypothetical protein
MIIGGYNNNGKVCAANRERIESDLSVLSCCRSASAGGHLPVEKAWAGCSDTQTDKDHHCGLTRKDQKSI